MKDIPPFLSVIIKAYIFLLDAFVSAFSFLIPESKKRRFVACGVEITTNIISVKLLIPDVITVNFFGHRFHNHNYDHGPWPKWAHLFIGPWKLVYLAHCAEVFIYTWEVGFAFDRAIDFAYLKRKGKKIVQKHNGEDIRSHKLMGDYYRKIGWEDHTKYRWKMKALLKDPVKYEARKKRNAEVTDRYADVVFSKEIDNMSYLKSKIYNFYYLGDPAKHPFDPEKFNDLSVPRIVHAPSSPSNKGTPLVRKAIEQLRQDGYEFDYKELIGMPHTEVLDAMASSHIVMNQFYSFCHGAFGVEALLSKNCMLTSADPQYTHELYEGAEEAWLITHYYQVYEKLKWLLEHPEHIQITAEKGREYAMRNFTLEPVRAYFKSVLEAEGIRIEI